MGVEVQREQRDLLELWELRLEQRFLPSVALNDVVCHNLLWFLQLTLWRARARVLVQLNGRPVSDQLAVAFVPSAVLACVRARQQSGTQDVLQH